MVTAKAPGLMLIQFTEYSGRGISVSGAATAGALEEGGIPWRDGQLEPGEDLLCPLCDS